MIAASSSFVFIFILVSSPSRLIAAAAGAAPAPDTEPDIVATAPGAEGEYLGSLHKRIHARWADEFVATASHTRPASDPLNDPSHQAVVLFSLRWDGTLVDASLVADSGSPTFDRAAVESIRKVGRFAVPPAGLVSDDGLTHFRWTLARDARLCSGGELRRHDDPIDESIPRLLLEHKGEEALLRVRRSFRSTGGDEALTIFARAWLARPIADPVADAGAAAALASSGDARQAKRLEAALAGAETAATAAVGLGALKIDVCPLVAERLGSSDPAARRLAVVALQAAAPLQAAPRPSVCAGPLAAMVGDTTLPAALRIMAAQALAATSGDEVRPALTAALEDTNPALRAVAVGLLARPHGGRAVLYRTLPFVHDQSVEVRAAAAAGMVHCCGDLALPELVLVFKEKDPRPALAVAAELGQSATPASADLLARMLKRTDPRVRKAVVAALLGRRDARARAALEAFERRGGVTREPPSAEPPSYEDLLKSDRDRDAADWIVAELDRLPPRRRVEVLSAWLTKKQDEQNEKERQKAEPKTAEASAGAPAETKAAASAAVSAR